MMKLNKDFILYYNISDYSEELRYLSNFFEDILTFNERSRLTRFRNQKDKVNFLLGRLLVKQTLNCGNIEFNYSKMLKPFLPNNINFNISHTDGMVVTGFSSDHKVGIDTEIISEINLVELLDYFASFAEKDRILAKEGNEQLKEFYHVWTMKEAILKSNGSGLIDDLPSIDINEYYKKNKGTRNNYLIGKHYISVYFNSGNEKVEPEIINANDEFKKMEL